MLWFHILVCFLFLCLLIIVQGNFDDCFSKYVLHYFYLISSCASLYDPIFLLFMLLLTNLCHAIHIDLTTTEMVSQGIIIFLAGYETTATTLQFLLYNLTIHPAIQQKVYNEIMVNIGEVGV